MRWVTYATSTDSTPRVGVVIDGEVLGLDSVVTMRDLLANADTIGQAGEYVVKAPRERVAADNATILAPILDPPTVRDFSAFEGHVRTTLAAQGKVMDEVWFELPIFYFSNPAVVLGPEMDVPIPPGTAKFDFELEVAAIVAAPGRDLTSAQALEHIAGFTIMNDWSARDVQSREMKLSLGPAKGKDSANGLGPWLVTRDELEPYRSGKGYDLEMQAFVNGRRYARGSMSDLYWSFEELVAYASRGTLIRPGDVIASGTCGSGCILELSLVHGEAEYPWLVPGDVVELRVDGLGVLSNRVVAGPTPSPWRST